jgi:hypothetical protein
MVQVVGHLPSKHEALSSNPTIAEREEGRERTQRTELPMNDYDTKPKSQKPFHITKSQPFSARPSAGAPYAKLKSKEPRKENQKKIVEEKL